MVFVALAAAPAGAAERIALLIGNQSYNAKVGPLKNPHNDIALIGAALRSLKFKVTEIKDADYGAIDKAINRHIQTVRREGQGSISLVYYAGHGAANPDTKINYLIPVDVANADDDELWTNSINLNRIVEALREQAPSATHYVVFDACRNELNLTHKGKRALADRGFVPIAYTPGVMIAYATAPGKTATDAGAGAGIYAKALAEEIIKPGLEALTMFRRVALRVNREIGQDPWMAASTLPEIYLAGEAVPTAPGPAGQLSEAAETWNTIKDSTSIAALDLFVARYDNTFYGDLAKARIVELRKADIAEAIKQRAAEEALWRGDPRTPGSRRDFTENASDAIYFRFDSADLTPEAQHTLMSQARWLRLYLQHRITIEGHDDEKGSFQFAVEIGAKRASAVRDFLIRAGVDAARVRTFSFGKEWPIADCHDESCWARNRRARTVLGGGDQAVPKAPQIEELKKQQVAAATPPPAAKPAPAPTAEPVVSVFSPSRPAKPLTPAEERALKPKDSFKECRDCPEMVVVPAGSFTMGSPASEEGRFEREGPQRSVTIKAPFAVGRFAATFQEWDACVKAGSCNGNRPNDQGWGRGRRPVINVSWDDAKAYVAWISKATGKGYRLLSEAEREYVARAGTTTPFWWGSTISTSQANYNGTHRYGSGSKGEYRQETVPVDSFASNPWGLYQVHGNVHDWVEDCWHDNYQGAPTDGSAWTTGDCGRRISRGGSWVIGPLGLRAAYRGGYTSDDRSNDQGFRLARTLSP